MTGDEVRDLVRAGESERVEFKTSARRPHSIAQVLTGFANARGGTVLFGVDEQRGVVGIDDFEQVEAVVHETARRLIEPPLDVSTERVAIDGRTLLVVTVPPGKERPYLAEGVAVRRHGNRLLRLSGDDLIAMLRGSREPEHVQLERLADVVSRQSAQLDLQNAQLSDVQQSLSLPRQVLLLVLGTMLGVAATLVIDLLK